MLANYFDHASTSPLAPEVRREMMPFLKEECGNPHSIHAFGRRAMEAVDLARERVASLLGAEDPSEIVFTSGATEANNWGLSGAQHIAISPFEHSSIREPALSRGAELLANEGYALLPPAPECDLLAVLAVSNETGALVEPPETSADLLVDATQALGKVPVDLRRAKFVTCSAHKIYGPKGVGALFAKYAAFPEPILTGGGQENGFRSGTLNVPAIVGFGAACALARDRIDQDYRHAVDLRLSLIEGLHRMSGWKVHDGERQSPFILSLSIEGVSGESLVVELDREGFAIGAGPACSAQNQRPSATLLALGLTEQEARGTVRISFGRANAVETARKLALSLSKATERLRMLKNAPNGAT